MGSVGGSEEEVSGVSEYAPSMPEVQRNACLECDLMIEIGELKSGQRARCPRCNRLLTSHNDEATSRALAFAFAAALLLVMANSFPFLELQASGLEKTMTIPRAGAELYRDGHAVWPPCSTKTTMQHWDEATGWEASLVVDTAQV